MNVRLLYDDAGDEWWTWAIWRRVPYGQRVVFKARVEPVAGWFVLPYGRQSVRYLTVDHKVQVESYGGTPPNMVGRVVGDDSQGGWSRPWANSLRPLLSLSSPMEERERERERESLVYTFFSSCSTPHREQQNDEVSEGVAFFSFFRITIHCICN